MIFEKSEIKKFKFGGQIFNQVDLLRIETAFNVAPLSTLEINWLINLNSIGLNKHKDPLMHLLVMNNLIMLI